MVGSFRRHPNIYFLELSAEDALLAFHTILASDAQNPIEKLIAAPTDDVLGRPELRAGSIHVACDARAIGGSI